MAADLAGSEVYFDPKTGKAFLTKVDKDGKIISQTDVRQANNPGNMIDNRLNLGSAVKNGTKNWEDWTIATTGSLGKGTTETDQRLNLLNFTKSKNALINSILSNDRAIAGVLKDNTDDNYQFYITDEERDSNVEKQLETQRLDYNEAGVDFDAETIRAEIEARMIKTVKDATGVYQPELTEKQVQMAKDIVGTEIEMQTGHKETKTGGRAPKSRTSSGGKGDGNGSGDAGDFYGKLRNAWDNSKKDPRASAATLSALSGDGTVFKWVNGGLQPSKAIQVDVMVDDPRGPGKIKSGKTKTEYVALAPPVKNLDDLSSYFFGETDAKGQGNAYEQMQAEKEAWKAKRTKTNPKGSNNDPLGLGI